MARPGLLREMYVTINKRRDDWVKRTEESKKFFGRGDYPCYYCLFAKENDPMEDEECAYCIHNPDAEIYEPVVIDISKTAQGVKQ